MQVLITGGAGFIGSTIAHRLLADAHSVVVLDNLDTGARENVPAEAAFVLGDVRDAEALERAMAGCEVVIHQAAMVSVARSVAEPDVCWDINVNGTRRVLECARRTGARRVVLASSAAVYGNGPTLPKSEDMPAECVSPYAYSKWLNEVDAAYFSRYTELETVCFRYFNVFGPRQRADSPYSGVISIAAQRALNGEAFTVFGTGEQSRDFVFSEDVAEAVYLGATTPRPMRGAVYNVGGGRRTSLNELLALVGAAVGATLPVTYAPARPGDVLHSLADMRAAREALGFAARVPLVEGLERTIAWLRACQDPA